MRVGMITDMYKPHVSGITTYVALHKRALEGLGHKVFVFTFGDLDYEDDEAGVIRSSGVPVNINDTGFHLSFGFSPAAQKQMRTMDVIHVHHPFFSGPLALRCCKPCGIPMVYTNHTRFDVYAQHYLPAYVPEALGHTFLQAYLPGFCARCDLVISPSPGIVDVLRRLGVAAPVKVIPNGIDLAPFQQPPRQFTRAELGWPEEAVVLVYVGRLSPEKNLAFLLRAFAGAVSACRDLVLVLVGDGPEMDSLRDQARRLGVGRCVFFVGAVEHRDIPGYLARADVFVTPSVSETFGIATVEGMAAGLPALGIASPGVEDLIVDGDNGFLSGPDRASFAARLVRLVMEPETRRRMAERARESARRFDVHCTAQAVLAEYERLVAGCAAGAHRLAATRSSI
jgi:glycosyltransferase involved in cell wall biosynthesis